MPSRETLVVSRNDPPVARQFKNPNRSFNTDLQVDEAQPLTQVWRHLGISLRKTNYY
jgi:hypothetical protein